MDSIEFSQNARNAGLSEDEIRLLQCPFDELSKSDIALAFAASDRLAEYNRKQSYSPSHKMTIFDRDKLLADGILSPIDRKTAFSNRKDWAEHLRANGCVEIGNDFNNAKEIPGKLRGDFDVRDDLGRATYQVMEKHGH